MIEMKQTKAEETAEKLLKAKDAVDKVISDKIKKPFQLHAREWSRHVKKIGERIDQKTGEFVDFTERHWSNVTMTGMYVSQILAVGSAFAWLFLGMSGLAMILLLGAATPIAFSLIWGAISFGIIRAKSVISKINEAIARGKLKKEAMAEEIKKDAARIADYPETPDISIEGELLPQGAQ